VAKLIYSAITSLDCFVEDSDGAFDWAQPSEEVFAFINERERTVGTYLFGRRMYETMVYWEGHDDEMSESVTKDFAELWRAADKIVFSTTLASPSSKRTRIERDFYPDVIVRMKETLTHDIGIGGAELASHALNAALVDEVHLYLMPIVIGAGKPAFAVDQPVALELLEERHFDLGQMFLRYEVIT
jgi:dihydrofolate reductase